MPRVDFSTVEDTKEFEIIPEGKYHLVCAGVKEQTSKTGHEQWNCSWQIVDGEFEGRIIFDNWTFGPTSLGIVKGNLKGLGFDVSGVLEIVPQEIEGIEAFATIIQRPYNDKIYNNIKPCSYVAVAPDAAKEDLPF